LTQKLKQEGVMEHIEFMDGLRELNIFLTSIKEYKKTHDVLTMQIERMKSDESYSQQEWLDILLDEDALDSDEIDEDSELWTKIRELQYDLSCFFAEETIDEFEKSL
jgi:hypothetical protein